MCLSGAGGMTLKGVKNLSAYKASGNEDEDSYAEVETVKSSLCCLQGCLAASAVGFSFFVALPTGILLVIYATNNDDKPLLGVGCALVTLPVVTMIVLVALCLNRHRLKRLGQNRVDSEVDIRKDDQNGQGGRY